MFRLYFKRAGRRVLSLSVLVLAVLCSSGASATSKVFLTHGETRLGFVSVRDGRVTVRGEDRLFQHAEDAVHRIEHVTGESSLIGKDNILLRETPQKLTKTLIALPKGCEVNILDRTGEWIKVEAYGGQHQGFVSAEELSDTVLFNPPIRADIVFKAPPPSLKEKYGAQEPKPVDIDEILTSSPFHQMFNETSFGGGIRSPLDRAREEAEKQAEQAQIQSSSPEGAGSSAPTHEEQLSQPVEPKTR
ncbi:MAG: SH3 domain-containing protein [Candidatus Omnitrophica bacterium]|nr:SH3 domain-containing protein [Candidatus Omnitrophota bacterium]